MKRAALALLAALVLSTNSGCCLVDRIIHCWRYGLPPGGCYPECGPCGDSCGGCGTCGTGYPGAAYAAAGYPGEAEAMLAAEGYPGGYPGEGYAGGYGPGGCPDCMPGGGRYAMPGPGVGRHRPHGQAVVDGGPPTGAITYPYYTNRGPRDFLAKSPPSIGP